MEIPVVKDILRGKTKRLKKELKIHTDDDSKDVSIIYEIRFSYSWMLLNLKSDDIIMDIGANIGCFTRYLTYFGEYNKIVCYEPEPNNFNLLKENTDDLKNIELVNACVISGYSSDDEVDLFIPKSSKNMGSCSQYVKRGRDCIKVKSINFKDELERIKPTIIKMDIEGAEYNLLLNTNLPDCVKKITIELHLNQLLWRNDLSKKLIDKFKEWNCIKVPLITGKNWHTLGGWER